ncbi:MAG: hypothetical protein ACSHWZ_15790 [Sulfitobacter sp.]
MSFVSHVVPGRVYETATIYRPDEWIHSVTLGHCDDDGVQVKAIVAAYLDPPYDTPPNMVELVFMISFVGPDGASRTELDGLRTKKYLVGEDRTMALSVICIETNKVLKVAQPDFVGISTSQKNLPLKALTKYLPVCEAVRLAGYQGGKVDDFMGHHAWLFEKST